MKKILKWGGIIIVVLIVIGIFSGSKNGTSTTSSGNNEEQQVDQTYAINQAINSKNMELTITSVQERANVGGEFFKESASEGGTLVVIQWQYKNTSDKPIGSFSQPSLKIQDAGGTEYSSDAGKTGSYATEIKLDRKVLSDLNPGILVKDAEVFEVSKESYSQGGWVAVIKADGKTYKVPLN